MIPRTRVFWYHYNKPASLAAGRNRWSVHYLGRCYVVDDLDIRVPARSRARKRQPRAVMCGRCNQLQVTKGVAVIS